MKIAFFTHSANFYGAERSLFDLVTGLENRGVKALVVSPRKGPLITALEKRHIKCIVHPYYGWLGRRYKILKGTYRWIINQSAAIKICSQLKDEHIDCVYTNTIASPVGAIVAKKLGVRHIWHVREFIHEDMGADFDFGMNYAATFVVNNTKHIVYNSKAVAAKFQSAFGGNDSSVIYNGVLLCPPNSKNFKSIKEKNVKPVLCLVGSLHPGKGQYHAVQALVDIKDYFPNVTLKIVGSGNIRYSMKLKELAVKLGVMENIEWCGFQDNVSEIYKLSDAALVCSRNEAFGRVVVEAMAEGCPVVAAASGGIPEIIQSRVNGVLYNREDPADLAKKVIMLLSDHQLYGQISSIGMNDVFPKFSLETHLDNIYSKISELDS